MRYRLRRPAWLWAIAGPMAAGFPAAIVFGFAYIPGWYLWRDTYPEPGQFFAQIFSDYLQFWPAIVAVAIVSSLPAVLIVCIIAMLIFPRVTKRSSVGRGVVFHGYEKYVWICLAVVSLHYPFWAAAVPLVTIFPPFLGLFPEVAAAAFVVIFISAAIARPIFFRVVTEKLTGGVEESGLDRK